MVLQSAAPRHQHRPSISTPRQRTRLVPRYEPDWHVCLHRPEQGTGGAIGEKKYTGIIRVKNPTGGYTFYPFEGSYQVAAKAVVVSPTKMNVLYIGVDNPMEISVPGVGQPDARFEREIIGRIKEKVPGNTLAKSHKTKTPREW